MRLARLPLVSDARDPGLAGSSVPGCQKLVTRKTPCAPAKAALRRLRAIEVPRDYFIDEVAMFVRIARHCARLELAVGPKRADDSAALQSGRAENGEDLLIDV